MTQPDDLDRRLEALGEPEASSPAQSAEEELWALEKLIRHRVRSICLKTLLAVVICAALVFGLINPLAKLTAFNPIPMEEDDGGFTQYLNAYYGTMQPYVRLTGTDITDTGFGTYDAALHVVGLENLKVHVGGYTDVRLTIRQGEAEVTSDPTGKLTKYLGRFDSDLIDRTGLLAELEKLPSSAYLRLSVGTDTPRTLEELRALPAEVVWAQVYDPDVEYQGGVNLAPPTLSGDETDPRDLNGPEMAQYYADNLELLLTQPKLLTSLGIFSNFRVYYVTSVVEEALASAREMEDFRSRNFCVQGSRDEILAFIDQAEPAFLHVDHIFLTSLSD